MQPTRTKTVLESTTAQKKTGQKMMIKRGKIEKTSETKCKSKGRSYSHYVFTFFYFDFYNYGLQQKYVKL